MLLVEILINARQEQTILQLLVKEFRLQRDEGFTFVLCLWSSICLGMDSSSLSVGRFNKLKVKRIQEINTRHFCSLFLMRFRYHSNLFYISFVRFYARYSTGHYCSVLKRKVVKVSIS